MENENATQAQVIEILGKTGSFNNLPFYLSIDFPFINLKIKALEVVLPKFEYN